MSRVLDYIAKYDETLTIAELKKAIKLEQKSAKQKETEEIAKVKEDFKDVYLKRQHTNILGYNLEIYHIEQIVDTTRCEDWSISYFVKGTKIGFSSHDLHFRKLKENDTYDTFSEEELRKMTKISMYDYKKYKAKYNELASELKNLLVWK